MFEKDLFPGKVSLRIQVWDMIWGKKENVNMEFTILLLICIFSIISLTPEMPKFLV